MTKKFFLLPLLLCMAVASIYAKRLPPPEVKPLSKGNFIYKDSAVVKGGYFFGTIIIESAGETKYWYTVPVYSIEMNKLLEQDVQWKFIKSMEFKNDEIITIINEQNKVFEFNINTYEVKSISGETDSKLNKLFSRQDKKLFGIFQFKYNGTQPAKKKLSKIEDVIAVAESVLFPLYGEEKIKTEMPYGILLLEDKWYVQGTLPENTKGGVFEITINAETSQIESVTHGK